MACLLALALFTPLVPGSATNASAYTNLSPAEVKTMVENGTAGTVIDVREYSEYCTVSGGHIPCALNYPWNTGYLQSHYTALDPDASYIIVCGSGNRSSSASSFLEGRGFTKIHNMSGGMGSWQGETQACDARCPALYFPHVATTDSWQTEIAIVNTGDQPVTGTLRALNADGRFVEAREIPLSAHGRRQIAIADEFTGHAAIRYIVFDTNSSAVQGYTKLSYAGRYRVAIPAVKEVNTSDIYISHIASDADWWTGVCLVNTTPAPKVLTITFNTGESRQIPLAANQHTAFDIAEKFFNKQPQPGILSAVISGAGGVIGLELFGSLGWGRQLDGILLTDKTTSTISYPHVANDLWWTGIVAYNPSELAGTITVTPYDADGAPLPFSLLDNTIPGKGRYIGPVANLGLPADTAWFKIVSTRPLTGFELFGHINGSQLAAYAGGGRTGAKTGVFAKLEKTGWTGIAFVNTEAIAASVTLNAYDDTGAPVATQLLTVGGYAKVVNTPEVIFSQNIGNATYIAYSSDRDLVGFQLNGSSDEMMLDGLPALAGGGNRPGLADVATRWNAGSPPDLLGYKPFPASSEWNRNVAADDVDPDSDNIIADLLRDDPGTMLHPDFGNSLFEGAYVGHPYDVVAPSLTPMVHVAIGPEGYADESDPGPDDATERVPIPVPIPADAHVEGGFDRHIYILDKEGYWLYELYHGVRMPGGGWQADQVTLWDLNDNTRRPWTWTSADQAGLSIFAGLVKWDEVQAAIPGDGDIGHAIRFTVMPTQEPFIPPATHPGGGNDGTPHSPKMGQRFRLKASWLAAHAAEFSPQCQVILRTLARYGMILADTGSNLFIQGTRDARWVEDADQGGVAQLLRVPPSAFEVLAHSVEYTRSSHPTGPAPSIASLTATPGPVPGGGTALLNWSVVGASTLIISPSVGPVRGTSAVVHPSGTTTYTLYATNEFGRSHASVTVSVP